MKIHQLSCLSLETVIFSSYLTEYFNSINGVTIWCPIWSTGAQLTTCLLHIIHFENTYLLFIFRVKCNFEFMRKGSYFYFLLPFFVFKFYFLNNILAVKNESIRMLFESWMECNVKNFFFLEICQVNVFDISIADIQSSKRFLGAFIDQE